MTVLRFNEDRTFVRQTLKYKEINVLTLIQDFSPLNLKVTQFFSQLNQLPK